MSYTLSDLNCTWSHLNLHAGYCLGQVMRTAGPLAVWLYLPFQLFALIALHAHFVTCSMTMAQGNCLQHQGTFRFFGNNFMHFVL